MIVLELVALFVFVVPDCCGGRGLGPGARHLQAVVAPALWHRPLGPGELSELGTFECCHFYLALIVPTSGAAFDRGLLVRLPDASCSHVATA